jgi:hypothetical protein
MISCCRVTCLSPSSMWARTMAICSPFSMVDHSAARKAPVERRQIRELDCPASCCRSQGSRSRGHSLGFRRCVGRAFAIAWRFRASPPESRRQPCRRPRRFQRLSSGSRQPGPWSPETRRWRRKFRTTRATLSTRTSSKAGPAPIAP